MKLTQQIIVKKNKKNKKIYEEVDLLCWKSKNLYNSGLYEIRQYFFNTGKYLNYYELDKLFNSNNQKDYKNLPSKVSQSILRKLDKNFISFFNANKDYKVNHHKYLEKPKLPKYKETWKGRNIVIYNNQAISKKELKRGYIKPLKTNLLININFNKNINEDSLCEVRLIPRSFYYIVEIVYDVKSLDKKIDNLRYVYSEKLIARV